MATTFKAIASGPPRLIWDHTGFPMVPEAEADPGLTLDASALHRLRKRGVRHERACGLLAREVVVDDHAVGVVDVLIDAVLDFAELQPAVSTRPETATAAPTTLFRGRTVFLQFV